MEKIRIGILGIGGTGGFFGGKLARHFQDDAEVEVVFIARNETRKKILQDGLKVESVEGDFTVRPAIISDDNTEIGSLNILLVCVKSYGLERAISQYKHNLKTGGIVITIQNLVNQVERVANLLPEGVTHLEGCAYIISNIVAAGHIKHKGGPATLFFGKNGQVEHFEWIEKLFREATVKATLSNTISETIWKKFLFISPTAVATSYFSCPIGELRDDPYKMAFLRELMDELFELIKLKKIDLKPEAIEKHLELLKGLPENGKTSMQLDIESGNPSEIDSLLEYVVDEGKKFSLPMKNYSLAFDRLKASP